MSAEFTTKILRGLLAGLAITAITASSYLVLSSKPASDPTHNEAAPAAVLLKKEIVAIKAQETEVDPRAWPSYRLGLVAELNGDRAFADKNYEVATQAYIEALHNFKSALEHSRELSVAAADSASPHPPQIAEGDVGKETIETKAMAVYEQALVEERRRLTQENTPNTKEESPNANDHLDANDSESVDLVGLEKDRAAMLAAKNNIDSGIFDEALFQEAMKTETRAEQAFAQKNFPDARELYRAAEGQYLAVVAEAESRRKQKGMDRLAAAQREIRSLIENYRSSYEKRSIQGLKELFPGNFTKEDENAWNKFFRNAKSLKARIAGESIQLGDTAAEVSLSVLIDYANHRGATQAPLALNESWTLEEKEGRWQILSREFK